MTKVLLEKDLLEAATLLRQGEVVAFPTETVYGLGAAIFNEKAVAKIFSLKKRPSDNPLIAHISSFDQLSSIAREIPFAFYLLAEAFFPGPLTIILKKHPQVPSIVSAGQDTIALRMPSHPLAIALISLVGQPLVAPSANLSGKPSATSVAHVLEDFGGSLEALLDGGETSLGIESTVLSLCDKERPLLLRPGSITKEQIEAVLGYPVEVFSKHVKAHEKVISPGMKYRHYAPKAPIVIIHSESELKEHFIKSPLKKSLLLSSQKQHSLCEWAELTSPSFYARLRYADKGGFEEILILLDPETLSNAALMNRLLRAAGLA